jgi:FlaA1/EpsC-like NDP-sugar epimerase
MFFPHKKIVLILTDLFIIFFSIWFSFSLRLEEFYAIKKIDLKIFLIYFFVFYVVFFYFKIYNLIIRFLDFYSVIKIAKAILFSQIIIIFINFYLHEKIFFPRSISFIAPLVIGLLVVLSRIGFNFIVNIKNKNHIIKNVILYGINSQTVLFSQNLRRLNSHYNIVGFIDFKNEFKKREVNGIKIYKKNELLNIVRQKKISDLFIGKNVLSNDEYINILNLLKDLYVRIKIIKFSQFDLNLNDLNDISLSHNNIPIDFYSVLNKKKIIYNNNFLKKKINNKNILVTGAGGSIGSQLCIQILKYNPKKLVLLDNSELNLFNIYNEITKINFSFKKRIELKLVDCSDSKLINKILYKKKFDQIYHAAAYKHVNFLEENVLVAIKNNIFGTINMLNFAKNNGTKDFIFISTDKAVRPKSILGITKKIGEMLVQYHHSIYKKKSIFTVVRFGNVIGSSGSVIPQFIKQIDNKEPITVRGKNVQRYFMSVEEAVELILHASIINKGFNIYALDMGKQIKIFEVARRLIQLKGLSLKNRENPLGDIVIKIGPLNKGEKISEELALGDNLKKTSHPKILICSEKLNNINFFKKIKYINNLINLKKLSKKNFYKILR